MQGLLNEEQKAGLWIKIHQAQFAQMSEKDLEVLAGILRTEPMVKALGQIYAGCNSLPAQFVGLDLMDDEDRGKGIKLQGLIQGGVDFIDGLLSLVTLPEERSDDGTEPPAE